MAEQKVQGLLGSNSPIHDLAGNPLFNIGMALMAHRQDARINPFTSSMGALQQAGEQQRIQAQQKRDEELRRALEEYFRGLGIPPPPEVRAQPNYEGVGQTATGMGQSEPFRDYYRMGWEPILNPR